MRSRAERAIAQGCLTNSKHWSSFVKGVYPTHIKASSGAYLYDLNDNKYLDFICGLGTNLLGYGHPLVETEVEIFRHQGKSPSLPHVIEIEAAEHLKPVFPWVQKWKFLKSGSEACSAAIRIARAFNKQKILLSEGYHGWHDSFTSLTPPANGCPSYLDLNMGIIKPFEMPTRATSAVIIEPIMVENSPKRIEWLSALRDYCTENGIILIFDEVITGFRYKQHSVSKAYNIRPDLLIIGKAMANGYPLAAVGGASEYMDGDYFVSSTYAGEIGSLAACKAVSRIIRENPNYNIDHLWNAGEKFLTEFNEHARPLDIKIDGYATRGVFTGDVVNTALFMQEACRAGMLFGKSWFISHAHIPVLNHALDACKDILIKMTKSKPKLKGEMPRSPFSMKARQ